MILLDHAADYGAQSTGGGLRNGDFIFPEDSFIFKGGDSVLLLGEAETVEKAAEKLREAEIT